MSDVKREMNFPWMAEIIRNIENFLDVPEHKQMYQDDKGNFELFVYNEKQNIQHPELAKWLNDLDNLAEGLLITSQGQADFAAHRKLLEVSGARVVCGERDSFGWLSGVIVARNFRYVYG